MERFFCLAEYEDTTECVNENIFVKHVTGCKEFNFCQRSLSVAFFKYFFRQIQGFRSSFHISYLFSWNEIFYVLFEVSMKKKIIPHIISSYRKISGEIIISKDECINCIREDEKCLSLTFSENLGQRFKLNTTYVHQFTNYELANVTHYVRP